MYKFKFADVGEGIHEGILYEWFVKEGDTVEEGQNLYSVETDKFNTEIPSPVAGVVSKIYYEAGSDINVGDLIVDIDDGSGASGGQETPKSTAETKPAREEKTAEKKAVSEGASVVGSINVSDDIIESFHDAPKVSDKKEKSLATPVARNLAKQLNVDINEVSGTGPNGRVLKEDIIAFSDAQKAGTSAIKTSVKATDEKTEQIAFEQSDLGEVERVKMSKMRQTIAGNMETSVYSIPHTASMYEFDADALWNLRKEINEELAQDGLKLSFMPFIIKALTIALKKHPGLNSELDAENKEIIVKHYYNIGMAVDTPFGLSVPVIKNADKLGLLDLQIKINDLAEQAREKKLPLDSMTGGTFTVTNYGAISGMFGTPVINYPEAAILGVGGIYKKAVFDENDQIVPKYVLPISISFDHRVVDGADVSRFANTLSAILSSRNGLLIY